MGSSDDVIVPATPDELNERLYASLKFWESAGVSPVLLRGLEKAGLRAVRAAELRNWRLYREAMLAWVAQWGAVTAEATGRGVMTPENEELLVVDVTTSAVASSD